MRPQERFGVQIPVYSNLYFKHTVVAYPNEHLPFFSGEDGKYLGCSHPHPENPSCSTVTYF